MPKSIKVELQKRAVAILGAPWRCPSCGRYSPPYSAVGFHRSISLIAMAAGLHFQTRDNTVRSSQVLQTHARAPCDKRCEQ
eukprot:11277249-Alexandrium_andersonii.AAC.1